MNNKMASVTALCVLTVLMYSAESAKAGLFAISVKQEKELGSRAAAEIESKSRIETGSRADRVARIGQRLADASDNRDYSFTYKIISDNRINAFALPGGHVYIFSGMLDRLQGDDELAAVLAHETTHVSHRHFAKQYRKNAQRQLGLAVLLGLTRAGNTVRNAAGLIDFAITNDYSRQDETDADMTGMEIMNRAGYNPHGMVEMLSLLKKASGDQPRLFAWTRDHPAIDKRVRYAERKEKELSTR